MPFAIGSTSSLLKTIVQGQIVPYTVLPGFVNVVSEVLVSRRGSVHMKNGESELLTFV